MMKEQLLIVNLRVREEMFDALGIKVARAPDHSVDDVALFQKLLREVASVLSGDPRNQRNAWC
jgi:hypothetical protein